MTLMLASNEIKIPQRSKTSLLGQIIHNRYFIYRLNKFDKNQPNNAGIFLCKPWITKIFLILNHHKKSFRRQIMSSEDDHSTKRVNGILVWCIQVFHRYGAAGRGDEPGH